MKRVINFNAGPAAIPLEVLEEARDEMLDWRGTGMSVMEVSHRSKEYDEMHVEAGNLFREVAGMGPEWKVLFCTGGASTQFVLAPMNLLSAGKGADYLVTGHWSEVAVKEAKRFGVPNVISSKEADGSFKRIPAQSELKLDPSATYAYMTSNNTIFGTQWQYCPDVGKVPLVCDMSSDIFSRPVPFDKFSLIFAGAQKNLGPSGVTVVAVKDELLARCNADLPPILSYKTYAEKNSLQNTPPCFSIYILNLILKWIKKTGGLEALGKINEEKAKTLYDEIDGSGGFFANPVVKDSRSRMNVVFRLPKPELEEQFVKEAKGAGIIGVKGHRSVGGIRLSIYNASSLQNVADAASFMKEFRRKNG